jgi:hypothetical protein
MSEQEDIHWTQRGGVKNLCFEHLAPKPKEEGWLCTVKECDGVKMILLPINKDEPTEFWQCTRCKRKITIEERDQIFEVIRKNVQDEYLLHVFIYDKQNNTWEIKSAEWLGRTRIGAKRKKITSIQREELIDTLMNGLEDALNIFFYTLKDYFLES